jgi:hypothetical protein
VTKRSSSKCQAKDGSGLGTVKRLVAAAVVVVGGILEGTHLFFSHFSFHDLLSKLPKHPFSYRKRLEINTYA